MKRYYAIDRGDGHKEYLTREEFVERIKKSEGGRAKNLVEELEMGSNRFKRFRSQFFTYEVESVKG